MGVFVSSIRHPSTDGLHTLAGIVVHPGGRPRAILHIVHGMTEHISRYSSAMRAFAQRGILCVGYDNLGHGYTASEGEYGYIAPREGYRILTADVASFATAVKKKYGEDLPYILMGHSMGSFIVRCASESVICPDKLIVMGTGGKNPLSGAALALIALNGRLYGQRRVSHFLDKLVFGGYRGRFEKGERNAWITTDPEIRKKYREDPISQFRFSVSAMGDLIRLSKNANRPAWFKNLRCDLPILLISGADDPVGNYGKGVRRVYQRLERTGHAAALKLYPGARHEILNDACRDEVIEDVLNFIG